jgi:hypothetical protein
MDEAVMNQDIESAPPAAQHPGSLRLLGQALLLNPAAYAAVRDDRSPFRRGFLALLTVLGIVALTRLIGLGLGLLAAPQLGSLQQIIGDFVTGLPWYTQQVQADPQFAAQFQLGYLAGWDALRLVLGAPVPVVVGGLYVTFLVTTLLNWLLYGILAHLFARWWGGQARVGQTLGVTALAYAPLLLFTVELVPGAVTPIGLVFAYLLVSKFLAIGHAHNLQAGQALAAVLAPYVLTLVVAAGVALFGSAYGLDQIPYLDQTLRALPPLALLAGIL